MNYTYGKAASNVGLRCIHSYILITSAHCEALSWMLLPLLNGQWCKSASLGKVYLHHLHFKFRTSWGHHSHDDPHSRLVAPEAT